MKPIYMGGRALAFLSLISCAQATFSAETTHLEQQVLELQSSLESLKKQISSEKNVSTEKGIMKNNPYFDVKIYGSVRADLSYQSDGGGALRFFNQINTVPLEGNPQSNDILKTTLAATRLGLDIKSEGKNIGGKLEFDFLGGSNADQFRIRHAYLTNDEWLIGQTWSNFALPDFMPETIDGLGYVGGSVRRFMQLRHNLQLSEQTSLVSALEDSKDAQTNMRLPALTLRLNQKFDEGKGLVSVRTLVSEKRTASDEVYAWGIGLGTKYQLNPKTELKLDYYHVNGDSSFVAWTNPGIAINQVTQEITEKNQFDSLAIGITHKFNPMLRGTLGYGYMVFDDDQTYRQSFSNVDMLNKNLWQGWANVMYSPVKPITLGMEYVYGERETFENKVGLDNRINLVAMYNF